MVECVWRGVMRCWSMSAHWMWNSILKWSFDGTSGFRNQHVSTYVHQHSMWMRPEVKLSLWGPSHQTILSIITQNLSTHWCPARTDTGAVSLCGLLHSVNAVSGHWTRSCWETAQVKILRRLSVTVGRRALFGHCASQCRLHIVTFSLDERCTAFDWERDFL